MRTALIQAHGVSRKRYREIRADLLKQLLPAGIQPIFARVSGPGEGDYCGLSWEWLDDGDGAGDAGPLPRVWQEWGGE